MAKKPQAPDKQELLSMAVDSIHKQFGKDLLWTGVSMPVRDVTVISTQNIALDWLVLGCGGIPRGRIIELFSGEGVGKSTMCLHLAAEVQKQGGVAAFIDVENALDLEYAKTLGVDVDNLLISQPDYAEQALDIAESLVRSGAVDLVIVDSVAALAPKAMIEGEMGDAHVGLQARLMSQAMKKLTAIVAKSNTALVMTNQLREKVGLVFGNPNVTPGGRALKFHASVRLELNKKDSIKKGDVFVGHVVKVTAVKNRMAPPFRNFEIELHYGKGINKEASVLDLGDLYGIIQKNGAWYSYGDIRLAQGKQNAVEFLESNPELYEELYDKIAREIAPDRYKHVLEAESDE